MSTDVPLTKRSVMVLFTDATNPLGHRVRLVAKEKDIPMDVITVEKDNLPEDLLELNPYGTLPTLIDRDLTLYDPQVIIEYLDERFPHPPLMSVDPISKARARQMLRQIEMEWYPLVDTIMEGTDEEAIKKARRELQERLIQLIPVFEHKDHFMNDDYSLVDVSMSVLLWRLPAMGVELPKSAKPIFDYCEKVLEREMFAESLTDEELDMRD